MYVDFPDSLKAECKAVTPRRELMAYQLTPGTVMWAHGKNRIYRPHPTHRFKATLFYWESNHFERDFRPAVPGDHGYEPVVVAAETKVGKNVPLTSDPVEESDAAEAAAKTPPPEPEPVKEPEPEEEPEKESEEKPAVEGALRPDEEEEEEK